MIWELILCELAERGMDSRKRVAARLKSDAVQLRRIAARLIIADAKTGATEKFVRCPACGSKLHYTISNPLRRITGRCARAGCLSVSEPMDDIAGRSAEP